MVGFTHVKRMRPQRDEVSEEPPITLAAVVPPQQQLRNDCVDVEQLLENLPRQLSHKQLARLLWTADYWPIFVLMLGQFSETAEPLAQLFVELKSARSRHEPADRATMLRLTGMLASLVHGEQSIRTLPFSLVAKSISYLMQRVPVRIWAMERKHRQLLSVQVLRSVLAEMVLCMPLPPWPVMADVTFCFVDQTYRQQGIKSNRERVEYISHDNLPLRIEREVVLNAASFPCPAILFPNLTAAARAEIEANGVYQQPFNRVQQYLHEHAIRANLNEFAAYSIASIAALAQELQVPVKDLTREQIMRRLLGRPDSDPGGPSHYRILPTCRRCDTKSYQDGFRITEHLVEHVGPALVRRVGGDGQWVLLGSYLKRRFPEKFRNILLDSGDFHALAHLMFALIELFWKCCAGCFAAVLELENVFERMPDLENNNYSHALVFLQSCALAIVLYFTTVVQSPSPNLFYARPLAYLQQLNHSGGRLLFIFYFYVCAPVLAYQRAVRSRNGDLLPKLHAFAMHVHRCVHKPNESKINLIALVSFYCIHPALSLFKRVMCGFSMLGRLGSCMAYDRLIEWINFRQSQRNSSFRAYDRSLQYTPQLQPMMHVDAAYTAATLGYSLEADDGFDRRVMNNALRLLEFCVQECGTDLTVATSQNPWWHTGNAVQVSTGSAREARPYDWFWDVMSGRSAGKWVAAQSAHTYVDDHLEHHFFRK